MWRYIQLTLLYSFFWLLLTSILVKNSWNISFVKFYQRNNHRVIYFRYFSTLIRKCAWRYVQRIIQHFAGYDDINKNSFKMKKLYVQCCSVFHKWRSSFSYSRNFVLISLLAFENWVLFFVTLRTFLCDVTCMPKKNQSAGGIKRSKHGYYNSFNNETIIKLLYEFRNSYKVLIHHGIPLFLIYF